MATLVPPPPGRNDKDVVQAGTAQPQGALLSQQVEFRGPIPPPDVLAEYEKTYPGLAARIVSMAEVQSAHRQELEKASVKSITDDAVASRRERTRGQIIGGIVVVIAIGAAVALGLWGNSAWANASSAIIAGIPLTGLVLVFMTGKRNDNEKSK